MERLNDDILNKHIRRWLLITLTRAEKEKREEVTKEEILKRVRETFLCISVIITKEAHEQEGYHYHAGVWNKDAHAKTMTKKIRNSFPEWEGRAIDVQHHKSFTTVCKYVLKEDKEPLVWGSYSLEQIRSWIQKQQQKKSQGQEESEQSEILNRLAGKKEVYDIYEDEVIRKKVLTFLPRMKEAFEDLKIIQEKKKTVLERIREYLDKHPEAKEYSIEELKEKYLLIDWVACQLCFNRPIKTKQLFLYGEPSTQKTLIISILAKVLNVYFASSRRNDFTGAHDYYHLWIFDEFQEPDENSNLIGATAEGSTFANTLLKVLDGQECRLDSKYSRVFKKKNNVPIILIGNRLTSEMSRQGPFRARFYRMRFETYIENIKDERIIATLWGCIERRIKNSPFAWANPTPSDVYMSYNKCEAISFTLIAMKGQNKEKYINEGERTRGGKDEKTSKFLSKAKLKDERCEAIVYTKDEQLLFANIKDEGMDYEHTEGDEKGNTKVRNFYMEEGGASYININKQEEEEEEKKNKKYKFTLMDYVRIPLKKLQKEEKKEKKKRIDIFKTLEERNEEEKKNYKKRGEPEITKNEIAWIRERGEQTDKVYILRTQDKRFNDYALLPITIQTQFERKDEKKQKENYLIKGRIKRAPEENTGTKTRILRREALEQYNSVIAKDKEWIILRKFISIAKNEETIEWQTAAG